MKLCVVLALVSCLLLSGCEGFVMGRDAAAPAVQEEENPDLVQEYVDSDDYYSLIDFAADLFGF